MTGLAARIEPVVRHLWATDPIDEPVVAAAARRLFLDTLGCMVAGLAKPEAAALARAAARDGGGPCRLPGAAEALPVAEAAALAGTAACWDEACEGLARAHGRPGLHAFGPALALGLARGSTLGAVLTALASGFEVGGRLGEALRIRPGMHVDGTWGTFGGAAAAARLDGLGAEAALAAIGIVACQVPYSLYLPVAAGSFARNLYVGQAARIALAAAGAAAAGFTAPPGALDEHAARALGLDPPAVPVAPPAERLLPQGYLKPFAAVRHVHYGAAAALARIAAGRTATAGIRTLRLAIYPEAVTYCGNRNPGTAIQAQFSLTYGLAWTLAHGDLGPDAYADLHVPEVRRLEALAEVVPDPALGEGGRRAAVLTVAGDAGAERWAVDAVAGDPDRPLDDAAVRAKFLRYAGRLPGAAAIADAVLDGPADRPLAGILAAGDAR